MTGRLLPENSLMRCVCVQITQSTEEKKTKRGREPRLADARLAGDQHHSSFAALRLLPTAGKQLDFLVTPDEGSQASCMQRFEPAFHRTCARYRPGARRCP